MKKFFLSFVFLFAFGAYALWASQNPTSADTVTAQTTPVTDPVTIPINTPATPVITPITPVATGKYKDGAYTGSVADAYYGYIQVEATVKNGALADVTFLQYPNDQRQSQFINEQAMPFLKKEALQAQSANVSGVSGASDTSIAFRESLASALAKAHV